MYRDRWNFVILACLASLTAFSLGVGLWMSGYTLTLPTAYSIESTSLPRTSVKEMMEGIEQACSALDAQFGREPREADRRIVLTSAAAVAGLADELTLTTPPEFTSRQAAFWDGYLERMKVSADAIADVAASKTGDLREAKPMYAAVKQTCVDCHAKFNIKVRDPK